MPDGTDDHRRAAALGDLGGCFIVRVTPAFDNAVTAERIDDANAATHYWFRRIEQWRFACRSLDPFPQARREAYG